MSTPLRSRRSRRAPRPSAIGPTPLPGLGVLCDPFSESTPHCASAVAIKLHREDRGHRVVHLVDAESAHDPEQQWPAQHRRLMPSSTLPSTVKAITEIAMKPYLSPGTTAISSISTLEEPAGVSAQAIAVAQPMISTIAPDSDAVSTSIGTSRFQLKWQ